MKNTLKGIYFLVCFSLLFPRHISLNISAELEIDNCKVYYMNFCWSASVVILAFSKSLLSYL